MQEQAKLIVAQTLDGEKHEFVIFNKQEVGKGAFGVVKKAIENSKPYEELVAKIIAYGDQKKKQKINRQIQILKNLPSHPNLVKVLPLKCYSQKNFYIFMEYCKDGTLQTVMSQKGKFTQHQIFDIFYQILNGYSVLWKSKILHQDLKPDNILVKNGVYKLTDFGFSIFHEGYKYSNLRQGTFPYMPLQKLVEKQYYANTKSDVYAIGVIMFKIITGHHPYVISRLTDFRDYISKLQINPIQISTYTTSKFSLKMQHLFDLILRMVAKKQSSRVDFDQVYKFIQEEEYFSKFTKQQKIISEQIEIQYKKFKIVQQSSVITIPFGIKKQQEEKYQQIAIQNLKSKEEVQNKQICQKLQKYLISMRLIVYFFDRLTRRLCVEKLKKQRPEQGNQQKVMICLLYLEKKVVQIALKQYKYPVIFSQKQWNIYKVTEPFIIKLLTRDETYIEDLIIQTLSESQQAKIQQKKNLIDKSKEPLQAFMKVVQIQLMELLANRKMMIGANDRKGLITLTYILSSLKIVGNFKQWMNKWEQLQVYFRAVETEDSQTLLVKIIQEFNQRGEEFSLDLGQQ